MRPVCLYYYCEEDAITFPSGAQVLERKGKEEKKHAAFLGKNYSGIMFRRFGSRLGSRSGRCSVIVGLFFLASILQDAGCSYCSAQ